MHVGVTKPQPRGTTLTLMEKGEKDEPWVIGVTCASLGEKNDLREFLGKSILCSE